MVQIVRADALYKQIANVVRDAIAKGDYAPGEMLPSEAQMSEEYKVSRPVVRQALIALRAEGLIEVRMGKGSFVRRSYNQSATTIDRSRTSQAPVLIADGEPAQYRQNADAATAELLGINENDPLFVLDAPTVEAGTGRKVLTRRLLPMAATAHTPLETDPFPDRAELLAALTNRYGKLTATEYVKARMPSPEETTALALTGITPIIETILVTTAKSQPVLAEVERTSAEAIQFAYRL